MTTYTPPTHQLEAVDTYIAALTSDDRCPLGVLTVTRRPGPSGVSDNWCITYYAALRIAGAWDDPSFLTRIESRRRSVRFALRVPVLADRLGEYVRRWCFDSNFDW